MLEQAGIFSHPDLEHTQGCAASAKHGKADQVAVVTHHNNTAEVRGPLKTRSRYEPDRLCTVPRFCFNEFELITAGPCYCGNSDSITGRPMLSTKSAAANLKSAFLHVSNLEGTRLNALRVVLCLPLWQNQMASSTMGKIARKASLVRPSS